MTTRSAMAGYSANEFRLIAALCQYLVDGCRVLARIWGRGTGETKLVTVPAVGATTERQALWQSPRRPDASREGTGHRQNTDSERRLETVADVSPNTRRAYESALRGLHAWYRQRHRGKVLDDAMLAEYLEVLAAKGRSASSAAMVVAAAKWLAKRQNGGLPAARTAEALRRYRRSASDGPGQVRGISWEEADQMCEAAAVVGDVRGQRDAALIAVASDALLRVSEVSSIQVDDVTFEEDGSARLVVLRSKTDQCGHGALLFLGPSTARLVREWILASGVESGALFRAIHKTGLVAAQGLGPGSIRRVIVDRARAVGIGGRVSGHSLRVGSAQSLAKRGAGLVAMQRAGRWASPDMPARYTRSQAAADGAVARLRHRPSEQLKSG